MANRAEMDRAYLLAPDPMDRYYVSFEAASSPPLPLESVLLARRTAIVFVFVIGTSLVGCSSDSGNDRGADVAGDAAADAVESDADSGDTEPDGADVDADDPDTDEPDTGDADPDVEPDADADVEQDVDADPPEDVDRDLGDVIPPDAETIEIAPLLFTNPLNSLSAYVEWDTPVAGDTRVDVNCEDEYTPTIAEFTTRTEHAVYLQGAWPNATCEVSVSSRLADGRVAVGTTTWDVGPLAEDLPELSLTVSDTEAMRPGWTLFDLTGLPDDRPLRFVIVDEQGRYRWYHRRDGTTSEASANEARILDEGVLLGGAGWVGVQPAIIHWDGALVWEGDVNQHHDIRPWPDASQFIFLGVDRTCEPVPSHTIEIIDRDTGEQVWHWRHCDHYLPEPIENDWSHLNTVAPVPGENAVIISSRHQSSLFKVNVDSGEIEWIMGHPPGTWSPDDIPRLALDEEDRFWRQHAPEVLPNGNILLYDNGSQANRRYSRLVEYAIDEEELTAEQVWEFRFETDEYAHQWGDADRLDNGNSLGVWGRWLEGSPSLIAEVTAEGEVVWQLETPVHYGIYRADRIDTEAVPAGYVIDP